MTLRTPVIALLAFTAVVLLVRTAAGAIGADDPRPQTPERRSMSSIERPVGPVPIVKQAYRNNCETAALSMLLAAAGVQVDQRVLQRQVARSGPLDPLVAADGTWTWGNPDRGFVGRAPGGGTAGGFGVYQGPIRRLAARYDVTLADLTQTNVTAIVARLRVGRPVMAWIGLSEGPYRSWRTPSGEKITVNFGEHTVILTGIQGSMIRVNDPLSGARREWSIAEFAKRWRWLGKRALAL